MEAVVLVPGIMGTRLVLPASPGRDEEEVWPPTPWETQFGYRRIAELQDKRAVPTTLINNVLCYSIYRIIARQLNELGFTEDGHEKCFVPFPYDWRLDNFHTAGLLATRLDALHAEGVRRIAIVAHSMGGLIARLLLETPTYVERPWFGDIHLFAALATPHLGAPLTLARVFGVDETTLGISGPDFATLASNRDFPSGYQLLPAPGEAAVWMTNSPDVRPLDIYDDATARMLGMDPALVAHARAQHDALAAGTAPAHVRYFYFAGVGHRTVTRVNVTVNGSVVDHAGTVVTRTADAGDGTVPLYSALPKPAQRQLVVNEHGTVFDGRPFRRVFFRLLGGDDGAALEAAGEPEGPSLVLSLDQPVQPLARDIEVTLKVAGPATGIAAEPVRATSIFGTLVVEAVDEAGRLLAQPPLLQPIAYRGPAIEGLTVYLPPMAEPGLFSLRFEGEPQAPTSVAFAASAA
ncbi:lipase/acyltransferase domain-containing protein [Xanthobacter sp. AM11]|uniref:lipase/acyltransferase domain-containing protein n=1 Tax=Xanthobacter sp. AM11 TaxID=3380643 RepID=UPI0039BFBBDD